MKYLIITTSAYQIENFLSHHLEQLEAAGNEIAVLTSDADDFEDIASRRWIWTSFPVRRSPRLQLSDIRAIKSATGLARDYDVIVTLTPKAGLVGQFAGKLARVPSRIHIFTGQPWYGRSGLRSIFARGADSMTGRLATAVFADSQSQARYLRDARVVPRRSTVIVPGRGSIQGVDLSTFRPSPGERQKLRSRLDIPLESFVFIFVGRLSEEKGVPDLLEAFARLPSEAHLLLVGPLEGVSRDVFSGVARCHSIGYADDVSKYLQASDILVLPSRREGFGSVVIEAAACGVPAIGSRIVGVTDAIEDGSTGWLVDVGSVESLYSAMRSAMDMDAAELDRVGLQARERVKAHFEQDEVVSRWVTHLKACASRTKG